MALSVKRLLRGAITRELSLDLEDRLKAEAAKAFEMVRERSGLDKKRARELEGQARFRMMEQGFEEVCAKHGGDLLEGGIVPRSDLKVFQPFMRFETKNRGVILGLASMPEPNSVPAKNKSRLAAVSLNYDLSPRLDLDGKGPKIGDVFALLLVSRDRSKAGRIEEIALGIINAEYTAFLFYEPLEVFLAGDVGAAPLKGPSPEKPDPTVRLRKQPKKFVPPESPESNEGNKESGG